MVVVRVVENMKDQKIVFKQEDVTAYDVAKQKTKEAQERLNNLKYGKDRLKNLVAIQQLMDIAIQSINSLTEIWAIPLYADKLSDKAFKEAFEKFVDIDSSMLGLGISIREETKDTLEKIPLMKVTQKLEDTKLGHMFG